MRPVRSGNATFANTIGTLDVDRLAASEACVPAVQMTLTGRRTSSFASSGRRSVCPSAQRTSMVMFLPST
jgi:hypothetical protein